MGNFFKKATDKMEQKGTKGLFRRQAERNGMSTEQWAEKEENSPDPKQRQRANFAEVGMKISRKK